MSADHGEAWTAGTWEGARDAQLLDVAALTPQQRWEWLDGALRLARASGALDRARRAKQREVDALWGQTGTDTSG